MQRSPGTPGSITAAAVLMFIYGGFLLLCGVCGGVMTVAMPDQGGQQARMQAMLDAVDAYLRGGGRMMYLGGNGFYWRIAYRPDKSGVVEVRRAEDGTRAWHAAPGEYYMSFTGEYGGLWSRQGRSPNAIAGVGFIAQGFDASSYYRRKPGGDDPRAAFIFEGVGDGLIGDFGHLGGGAAGDEIDAYDVNQGSPPHALVLATSEMHSNAFQLANDAILVPIPCRGK